MPNRKACLALLVLIGCWTNARPALSQALVPHTLQLDFNRLEQQGLGLLQEAAQLAQFQQYELALPRAQLATQLAPNAPEAWGILGRLYLLVNESDKGIDALKRAQQLDNKNSAILFALGSAYFQKGNYNQSVASLQAGLRLKPNTPGALFDLGNAYLMLRKFDEAVASYEKAIGLDGKFWPAMNNIGLIRYEQSRVDEAVRQWQAAIKLDDKAAEPQLAVAVALYTKGDREQGLALGEAAIKIDSRYGDPKFLKENLWGERLLTDTRKFLASPRIQATLAKVQDSPQRQPASSPQ